MKKLMSLAAVGLFFLTACGPVAVAGAAAGGYVWNNNSLQRTYNVSVDRAHSATVSALRDMRMTIRNDEVVATGGKIDATSADNKDVDIRIHPDDGQTRINIRYGVIGDKDLARMVHEKIQAYL